MLSNWHLCDEAQIGGASCRIVSCSLELVADGVKVDFLSSETQSPPTTENDGLDSYTTT